LTLLSLIPWTTASAQSAPQTGRSYWGFDLGLTSTGYIGNNNFFWPVESLPSTGVDLQSFMNFDDLGVGFGWILGGKVGFALSPSIDLEGKLRYLTNYSSKTEDHTITNSSDPTASGNVTNQYSLSMGNLDLNALLHFKLSNSLYGIGGLSFSSLLSNNFTFDQKITTPNAYYTDYSGGIETTSPYQEMSSNGSDIKDWLNTSRAAVQLGVGSVFPLGSGNTLMDAELMLSIPVTNAFNKSGQDNINQWAAVWRSRGYDVKDPSFPSQFYASFTIGIRLPFSSSAAAEVTSEDNSTTSTSNASTTSPIDADGKVALTGNVRDAKSGKPIDANMTVVDLTTSHVVATDRTYNDGNYSVKVNAPGNYSVTADADGYLFGTAYFQVDAQGRILKSHPDIQLSEASTGRTRLLVFFDFNSADLQKASYPELDRAVRLMKAVPTMQVEIAGYTDSVGTDSYNKDLSQRRANAVRDYLV
jgi:outer membrane protein OmpA-like peptidoglycan-associated protein